MNANGNSKDNVAPSPELVVVPSADPEILLNVEDVEVNAYPRARSVLAVSKTGVPDVKQSRDEGSEVISTLHSSKLATKVRLPLTVNEYVALVETTEPPSVQFTNL